MLESGLPPQANTLQSDAPIEKAGLLVSETIDSFSHSQPTLGEPETSSTNKVYVPSYDFVGIAG